MPNSVTHHRAVSFSQVNTPNPQADLEGYRENLRQCLADLIERMDLHSVALEKLVSGADEVRERERAAGEKAAAAG